MTDALAIGVPYSLFWHLNPKKLKPFVEAYHKKQREIDAQMWYMGQYVMSALNATVMNLFRKSGAEKNEYFEKPLLEEAKIMQKEKQLSEEEVIKRTKALFAQLETKANNEKRQKRFMEKNGKVE